MFFDDDKKKRDFVNLGLVVLVATTKCFKFALSPDSHKVTQKASRTPATRIRPSRTCFFFFRPDTAVRRSSAISAISSAVTTRAIEALLPHLEAASPCLLHQTTWVREKALSTLDAAAGAPGSVDGDGDLTALRPDLYRLDHGRRAPRRHPHRVHRPRRRQPRCCGRRQAPQVRPVAPRARSRLRPAP